MNEHDLTEQLQAAAATVDPVPDLAEIELGAGRLRSRRRLATGVVAAMLVAGAGGAGFGLGRSLGDDGGQLAAGEVATSTPTTSRSTGTGAPAAVPLPTVPTVRATADSNENAASTRLDVAADYAYDEGYGGYYVQEPMTLVYERTLDDGLRIRVQRGQSWLGEPEYGSGWKPAPYCWATTESRLTIDGPDIVDVSGYGWYEELFKGLAVSPIDAGQADGHPVRLLQVQAAADVTEVAVTWADGGHDRTAVVNGVAVLMADGVGAYHEFSLEVVDASGVRTLTDRDLDYYSDPDYRAGCEEPPPALPPAGEQPADPAAAEAALRERFQTLWDRTIDEDAKPDDLLDDWTGIDEALTQVFEGGFAESAESAEHTIEELVFTGPTEAWFRYGIDTITGYFGQRYGYATLTDGLWVFPRALVCQDLGLAGGNCEPWVESIFPPSWYERYGDPYVDCWIDDNGEEVCQNYGDGFNSPVEIAPRAGDVESTIAPPSD